MTLYYIIEKKKFMTLDEFLIFSKCHKLFENFYVF